MDSKIVHQYLRLLKRWWWLLVVSTIVPMVISYHFASKQPDMYASTVTLMVGTSLQSANPDRTSMATSNTLADAYARLVTLDPITAAVIERLGLERSSGQLASQVTTWVHPEAQLLEIRVVDSDPRAAALIANALAEELIAHTPAADAEQQDEAAFTRRQLDDLRTRIEKVQADIKELSASMVDLTSAAEIEDAQERLAGLREIESMYQSSYAQLFRSYVGNSPNILQIFDPAVESRSPMGRRTGLIVAVSGVAGLGLAAGAVLLIEYLDDAVRWEEETRQTLLDMPVLGAIPRVSNGNGPVVDLIPSESPSAEMVRALRTNIFLAAGGQQLKTLLVTSPTEQAGKSFVVAQLGLAIAASGKRVVVVDMDLRKPTLHEYFDLPNLFGVSGLLGGYAPLESSTWPRGVQETGVENLYLLPGGKPPRDPSLLLTSSRLRELLDILREQADVVVIDSPPGLVAADAAILASATDGAILVVSAGTTSRNKMLKVKDRLTQQEDVNLLGVAFNRVSLNGDSHYYYGYGQKRRSPEGFWGRLRARLPFAGDRMVEDERILNLREIAEYMGVTRSTARRWCESGRVPAFKSRLQWRIKEEDLVAAVAEMVPAEVVGE